MRLYNEVFPIKEAQYGKDDLCVFKVVVGYYLVGNMVVKRVYGELEQCLSRIIRISTY